MSTEYRSHLPGCDLFSVRPCHCNVGHDHVTETGYLAEEALKAENARLRDKRSLQVLNLEAQLETAKEDNATLQQQLREVKESNGALHEWKSAIEDALVVGWCLSEDNKDNPRKAINDLLVLEQQMALDPAISKPAAELHERITQLSSDLVDAKQATEAQMEAAHSWRTEADRLANENAELRRQLGQSTF